MLSSVFILSLETNNEEVVSRVQRMESSLLLGYGGGADTTFAAYKSIFLQRTTLADSDFNVLRSLLAFRKYTLVGDALEIPLQLSLLGLVKRGTLSIVRQLRK